MTLTEEAELLPPRAPVNPVRRRRVLVTIAVIAIMAAIAGASWWWYSAADDRARRAFNRALPAAEAAWPAAQTRILALRPPTGWTADPTLTPCGLFGRAVTCWRSDTTDVHRALTGAVAALTSHGATVGDPLLALELRANGATLDQMRCTTSTASAPGALCSEFLTWDGAPIEVTVIPGFPAYGLPASVLVARGYFYSDARQLTLGDSPPAGNNVADLRHLTGLPAEAFHDASCQQPSAAGCLRWVSTITTANAPDAVFRRYLRVLTDHGLHVQMVRDLGSQTYVASATRNRAVGGGDPVIVSLRLSPSGGGTAGTLSIMTLGGPVS